MTDEKKHRVVRSCSVEGCGRQVEARGWCSMHYLRWKRTGNVATAKPDRKQTRHFQTCVIDSCDRPVHALGWCSFHYEQNRPRKTCSIKGCPKDSRTRGMCDTHYAQVRRAEKRAEQDSEACKRCGAPISYSGTGRPRRFCEACLQARKSEKPPCAVSGCDNKAQSRGWCFKHYARWQKHGDPGEADDRRLKGAEQLPNGSTRKTEQSGYVRLYFPDPERPGRGRHVLEHRYVMEQVLGRRLKPHEHVHHVNGDRADNRESNLELWTTSHPKGQRVADKLKWAREIMDTYANAPTSVTGRKSGK